MKSKLISIALMIAFVVALALFAFGLIFVAPWIGGHLFHGVAAGLGPVVGTSWARTIAAWAVLLAIIVGAVVLACWAIPED